MARVLTYEQQEKIYGQHWTEDPDPHNWYMVQMHCPLCGKKFPPNHWMRYPHTHGSQWLDPDTKIWYHRLLNAESCSYCNQNIRNIDFYDCTEGAPIYQVQKVYCKDCGCQIGTLHKPELFGAKEINGRWVLKIYRCRHCSFRSRYWFLGPLAYIISSLREPHV